VTCLGFATGPAAGSQRAAPGGMSPFTVAIGGLPVDSRANWVQLGTYSFTASRTVTESHFHWSRRKRV
jgi:hypothetical protein